MNKFARGFAAAARAFERKLAPEFDAARAVSRETGGDVDLAWAREHVREQPARTVGPVTEHAVVRVRRDATFGKVPGTGRRLDSWTNHDSAPPAVEPKVNDVPERRISPLNTTRVRFRGNATERANRPNKIERQTHRAAARADIALEIARLRAAAAKCTRPRKRARLLDAAAKLERKLG